MDSLDIFSQNTGADQQLPGTANLYAFVFIYAKNRFSHDMAHTSLIVLKYMYLGFLLVHEVIKLSMLNSTEHEIYPAPKKSL